MAVLVVLLGTVLIRGWVVSVLWGWFMVPLGARPIGLAWAYGLCILGVILSGATGTAKEPSDAKPMIQGIAYALVPLILLGLGWVAHVLM